MNKLLTCTAALLLVLGTNSILADDRSGWNDRNDRGSSRGWDRGRHDNDRGWRDRDDRRWNNRRHDHRDNVSVSLSFGNVWNSHRDRSWTGFGIGYNTFNTWGYNDWRYNNRRPVIVHNTYIDNPAPRTRVITRSTRNNSGTSLLRDINGRCFERETDSYGNETRTELPAEACNF